MDKVNIILTPKESQEIVWDESDRYKIIKNNIVDNGRWTISHEVIIQDNETKKYYKSYYNVGATEAQDESPFEYDKEVTWYEVFPIEKKVIVYE